MHDFVRHRIDVEVVCGCGHSNVLDAWEVWRRFSDGGWCTSLLGSFGDPPSSHFRCTRCRGRPVRIGPIGR